MAGFQIQQRAYAPPPQIRAASPSTARGTVRVAAMAAHHARQAREKTAQRANQPSALPVSSAPASNSASPSSRGIEISPVRLNADEKEFHVKKKLHLQLNMDAVKKPELPLMVTLQSASAPPSPPLRQHVQFAAVVPSDVHEISPQKLPPQQDRRRRASSVTLSMNSPEGAEFAEVAHDGPAQLGTRTKRVKKLGKGAGGTVFLSIYLPILKLVAVKEVVVYKEDERRMVKHELHALHENLAPLDVDNSNDGHHASPRRSGFLASTTSATCPYQVAFYGAFLTPARCAVSIVMEFMDMGSLQDLIDAKVTVPEPVLRHGAFCCLTALEHMHSHQMIHRDIKPANILLNRYGDFKIADFGLAGTLSKSASFFSEFEGTMMYMAPERITGQNYTYVSDVWSLGVVLFSLATGAYPFAVDDGFFGLEEAICTDPLPPMPNRFSPACRDFLKGLIRRDPDARLTSAQALSHPFLRGYSDSSARREFQALWQRIPLRSALHPEDTAAIVRVVVDHAQRHPEEQVLPAAASCTPSPPKDTFFSQINEFFGRRGRKHHCEEQQDASSHLQHLADECGVTLAFLDRLIQQECVGKL